MNTSARPSSIDSILNPADFPAHLIKIAEKAMRGERISVEEGITLYREGEIGFLGSVANYIRQQKHGDYTYFNRNFHVEPTNICVFDCKFCSYSRLLKQKEGSWEMSAEQMLDIVRGYKGKPVTEVHIVGGVHPRTFITL